jgi:hypothetical protein
MNSWILNGVSQSSQLQLAELRALEGFLVGA